MGKVWVTYRVLACFSSPGNACALVYNHQGGSDEVRPSVGWHYVGGGSVAVQTTHRAVCTNVDSCVSASQSNYTSVADAYWVEATWDIYDSPSGSAPSRTIFMISPEAGGTWNNVDLLPF